jgi:hypothetical protein
LGGRCLRGHVDGDHIEAFRVIFSVPSMIAWFAASRTSHSKLPITPRQREPVP